MSVTATGIRFDGVGDGEPLLLLAGQANSRHRWDPVRDDLAARRARHRGEHAPEGAECSTRRFAADAVGVLDVAGIGRAHVHGTSMGGKVTQWLAIDHPDRVGALVLGRTTPGGPQSWSRVGTSSVHWPGRPPQAGGRSPSWRSTSG